MSANEWGVRAEDKRTLDVLSVCVQVEIILGGGVFVCDGNAETAFVRDGEGEIVEVFVCVLREVVCVCCGGERGRKWENGNVEREVGVGRTADGEGAGAVVCAGERVD